MKPFAARWQSFLLGPLPYKMLRGYAYLWDVAVAKC